MPFFPEHRETPHHASPEAVSWNRPPQLNETVCGCRCGCGCSNVFLGSDGADDEGNRGSVFRDNRASVSDQSDIGDDPLSPNGPEQHITLESFESRRLSPLPLRENNVYEIQTRYGGYVNDVHGFRLSQRTVGQDPLPRLFRSRSRPVFENSPDSMNNESVNNEERSNATSGDVNIRCMSPGPGIGAWVDEGYYFHDHPLRMTPQRRLCRGVVASHMVLRDDETLVDGEDGFLDDGSLFGGSFR
ncbi:hypothetical protein P154DRAFT_526003 [Amniculicola lignicola CBS 123094]|uniref:Uncharacterized protein n=1 Tax=Amniculicola lignicola CBS 123094 TaxID=1392246 RepID=A0A6A5W4U4_9PLEO|nr:hypothetical protein P154DRAFT_526003 [Amniculicola lignicola CBS 123094]